MKVRSAEPSIIARGLNAIHGCMIVHSKSVSNRINLIVKTNKKLIPMSKTLD